MPRTIDLDNQIWPLMTGVRDALKNSTKTRLNALDDDTIRCAYYPDMDGEYIRVIFLNTDDADLPTARILVRLTRSGMMNNEIMVQEIIETGQEILSELLNATNRRIGNWTVVQRCPSTLQPDRRSSEIAHWEMVFVYTFTGDPVIT